MKGLEQFLELFGGITISQIVTIVLALVFMVFVYKKVKQYFDEKIKAQNERAEAEKQRDKDIKEALEAVRKYPEYRQQSINIQKLLEGEIQELRALIQEDKERIVKMEEQERKRECNKLRDILLQNYRYYTNKETNPSGEWTKMEAEAFWELFADYEELGGDGYMHTEVQPEMQRLIVIDSRK